MTRSIDGAFPLGASVLPARSTPWRYGQTHRCGRGRGAGAPLGARAGPDAGGAALLAGAVVAVQRAGLDRLVDQRDELAVIGVGLLVLPGFDRAGQATEVRLDRRRVAAVLEALAVGAGDALFLGGDVGHRRAKAAERQPRRALR